LQLRWDAEARPASLRLAPGSHDETQVAWVAYDPALTFAWPVCGEGFVRDPGVCDGLTLEGGCDTAPVRLRPGGWTWLAAVVLLLTLRRRRATAAAVLVLVAPHAQA